MISEWLFILVYIKLLFKKKLKKKTLRESIDLFLIILIKTIYYNLVGWKSNSEPKFMISPWHFYKKVIDLVSGATI